MNCKFFAVCLQYDSLEQKNKCSYYIHIIHIYNFGGYQAQIQQIQKSIIQVSMYHITHPVSVLVHIAQYKRGKCTIWHRQHVASL